MPVRVTLVFLLFAALNLSNLRAQMGTMGLGSGSYSQTGDFNPSGSPSPNIDMSGSPSAAAPAPKPIFISGNVTMDDGSSLPSNVDILTVCGARQRVVAHAASGGAFSFQWNSTPTGAQAASDEGRVPRSAGVTGIAAGEMGAAGICDLRASSSGYTSSRVEMSNRYDSGTLDAGTIVLHRLTGNEGRVVSVLALQAPKDAAKDFEKGTAQAAARKFGDAAASFQKALARYPQYPDAWLGLGKVELQLGAKAAAREDFQKALDLDAKLAGPWQELGFMASDESKWEDASKYLDRAVELAPMDSTAAWFFSALANYSLRRFDIAERNIRAEIKLNGDRNPGAEFLLGEILIGRDDLKDGAGVLRKYIQTWPGSDNVEFARKQLSQIENQLTLSAPPQ